MDERSNIQKANEILKKYKRVKAICLCIIMLIYVVSCWFIAHYKALTIVLYVYIIFVFGIVRFLNVYLTRKMIYSVILDQLDASLYSELVRQGKMYAPSAISQIEAEYFSGNYENVIAACNRKLSDKRTAKKYKHFHLTFLANCYFDVGDNKKFNQVCDLIYQDPDFEKRQKKIFKRTPVLEFYAAYIKRDWTRCYLYIDRECSRRRDKLNQTSLKYKKARILLLDGQPDKAKILFGELAAEAPGTNYASIAAKALGTIAEGIEYEDAFEELHENEDFVIASPSKSAVIAKAMFVLGIVCLIGTGIVVVVSTISNIRMQEQFNDYKNEMQALLEQDYTDVEIIDLFDLAKNEKIFDSMFIAKTSDSLLVGSTYVYSGEDALYYDTQLSVSLSLLTDPDQNSLSYGFEGVVTDCYVECGFYYDEAQVSETEYYSVSFTVANNPVYFVITNVTEDILSAAGN